MEAERKKILSANSVFPPEMILGNGDHAAPYHLRGYAPAGVVITPSRVIFWRIFSGSINGGSLNGFF